MKKLLLFALVMLGGVMQVSAADDLYLRSDFNGTDNWDSDVNALKFTYVETNASNEDVYTYTINSSDIKTSDIWFRLHISGWGAQICPYTSNGSYTYSFLNGQNETYGAKYEKDYFQGTSLSFGISHSTIKASQYKISVFRGNNVQYYENENCKVMWIKVEIVSMPATVSALGYSTFSCNRALDLDNISDGLTAYKASVSDNKVVLTKATGKVVAETGLLLAGTTGTIPVVETSAASTLTGNLLHGTVTTTNVAASVSGTYHYFLAGTDASDIGFYNLASAADCAAGKAYLETTTELSSDPATARAAWIFQDEVSTGIQNVTRSMTETNEIYDLQGRIVKTPKSGLYIKNGKKIIVK